jgi:hypothetical protein
MAKAFMFGHKGQWTVYEKIGNRDVTRGRFTVKREAEKALRDLTTPEEGGAA